MKSRPNAKARQILQMMVPDKWRKQRCCHDLDEPLFATDATKPA